MEIAQEIKDFLTTRRARITPDMVGLPSTGRRRVPGLRREEVAMLAGLSAEYYIQIERGRVAGVSEEILHAIIRALRLDDVESEHFLTLTRAAASKPSRRAARTRAVVSPTLQAVLDSMVTVPAVVLAPNLDLVAGNTLGLALYAPVAGTVGQANVARFLFLDPDSDRTFPDWNTAADDAVAMLRAAAAADPQARALTALVGELSTASAEFRTKWAAHRVVAHRRGGKQFRHEAVGEMALSFEALEIAGSGGLILYAFAPEPASPAADALRLLSSLVADRPAVVLENR
ncbi:helix-turn-helix transcriptional regulator [Tsukamurella sp. NPDC003166]|uniref:helix-turn-helix domain-containing protein n=1 Tax=Tsukamurella sp. NPDC003166 TaxID=3154444 RepID=UPI0033B35E80